MTTAADAQQVPINVVTWGRESESPVILLHGLRAYAHWYDDLAEVLEADRFVVAQDLRGRGASGFSPGGDYRVDVLVDDVEDIVDSLGAESISLVGHSMGGSIALAYAGRHPDKVEKLVLADMSPSPSAAGMDRMRREMEKTPTSFPTWEEARRFVAANYRTDRIRRIDIRVEWMLRQDVDGQIVWRIDPAIFGGSIPVDPPERMWRWIRRVQCPTLVVRGAHSDILTETTADAMVHALPVGSRHVELSDAGHMLLDDNPAGFCDLVTSFLA